MHTVPNVVLEEESWSNLRMCWDRYGTQIRFVLFDPGIHSDTSMPTTPEGSNLPSKIPGVLWHQQDSPSGGTIRNIDTPRSIKYMFSSQQLLATSTFLFGDQSNYAVHDDTAAQNPDIAHAGS
jgi:hypothetical protein